MKYNSGDILYFVNPFVFTIDKVKIEMGVLEEGELFYIDNIGAYLKEEDLFVNLKDAQKYALENLNKFYNECRYYILNDMPKLIDED